METVGFDRRWRGIGSEYALSQCRWAQQQSFGDFAMGQHNAEIAAELGFTEGEIAAMQNDGVLYEEKI